MRGGSSPEVVRHLRTLFHFGVAGSLGDEQLLDRFLARRDEAGDEAFAELVQRHGPMVLGVCRRILGHAHDAEDAFQATFLVLARKAASVARREKVASWLYGVAVRTAKEARTRAARRRAREERVSAPIHVEPPDDGFPDELRAILDEELGRLPARHRGPVVLCELEGVPRPEAARRLGVPEGTLSSRLARAKARLRDRLAARGVALPVAAVAAILAGEARATIVPLHLLESTVEAATLVAAGPTAAAGLSASAASLSEGVLKTMLVAKLKGIVLAVGTMTAVVSGAVVLAQPGQPGPQQRRNNPNETENSALRDTSPPPGIDTRPAPEDRTAALEKKLDRVLEALERLAPGAAPHYQAHSPRNALASGDLAPVAESRAVSDTTSVPPKQEHQAATITVARGDTVLTLDHVGNRPLSDRVQALEQQMQQVQARLAQLEGLLKALDARVGGGGATTETIITNDLVGPRQATKP
jgi:RNA polymerase sigma-70 factor (ECF subfamily)